MLRFWEIRTAALAAAALIVSSSAFAQDNPPPWWNVDDGNTTAIGLQFDTVNINTPNPLLNPFGVPTMSASLLWLNQVTSHQGVIGITPGGGQTWLELTIPNDHRSNWIKQWWMQFDWYVDGNSFISSQLTTEQGSQIDVLTVDEGDIGEGWLRLTLTGTIIPQPGWEQWRFEFNSGTAGQHGAWMDNFYFGTHCIVPEPGTMAALGLGALALLRRRRK